MEDRKCRGGKCRTGKCGTTYTCIEKKLKKFAMHRLVTFMLSDVAVVPNVPLKSAKHAVPPQIRFKTLNTFESQQNTRKTMSIGVWHKGHPFPISVTVFAHAEQKRAWLPGTNATPSRGTSRRTFRSLTYPDKVLFFVLTRRYSWLSCSYTKPRPLEIFFVRIRHHVTTTNVL